MDINNDIQEFQIEKEIKQAPNVRITIETQGQPPVIMTDCAIGSGA